MRWTRPPSTCACRCFLVAIVKKRLALEASLYTLLQIFSLTLFEKMPMPQALSETTTTFEDTEIGSQLNLFSF
jgi:hypothetical protein